MTGRPRTKPRKIATQRRSRATVDALVEATARILVREGYGKASTNRIAEVAGVSIGSLYQYFPGKEALVAAVIDRHHGKVMRIVGRALAHAADLPPERAVRVLVVAAFEAHRVAPRLHGVLAEQIPRTGRLAQVATFNREAFALFRDYLARHEAQLRVDDVDRAAFVCGTSIEALSHQAVLYRARDTSTAEMDALVDDTTRMVLGYLGLGNL